MSDLETHLRNTVAMLNAAIRICRIDQSLWEQMQVGAHIDLWSEQVKASMALIAKRTAPK